MFEVTIKGNKQLYFTNKESIPATLDYAGIQWSISPIPDVVLEYIVAQSNIAPIVAPGVPDWHEMYILYVHWYEEIDLNKIESELKQGHNVDPYFENTVVLDYSVLCCLRGCKTWWHTLEIPRGEPFASDPFELNWSTVQNGHVKIKTCPKCGGSFRRPVILIIGQADVNERSG